MAGRLPGDQKVSRLQRPAQQFGRARVGHPQEHLLAGLARDLNHAQDAEVAIPHKKAMAQGAQNDFARQRLFAPVHGTQRAVQGRAGETAESHRHAHQAPIGSSFVLIAVGRKRLGNVRVRAPADGGAIQQGHDQGLPERGGALLDDPAALEAEGLGQEVLRQTSSGVAVGAGGRGTHFARELAIEPVGAAGAGVGDDGLEAMVVVDPLKEQIPEGDQRGKQALIEGERFEGGELEQGAAGQELEKNAQQVIRGERWSLGGFGFLGVFFDFL